MAHIPDGILSAPVLVGGAVLAAAGVAWGLRHLDDRAIPRAAILSAAFFAGSLVAIPAGPSSVHLLFGGLMGIMLGPATFAAVTVALLLQALLFGFGGLTTLGVNVFNIAAPGVLLGFLLGPVIRTTSSAPLRMTLAASAGALAVLGTGGLVALALALSAPEYTPVASVLLATYLPLALAEAVITAVVVTFLARVHPEALQSDDDMIRALLLGLALAVAMASPAAAHKLKVFATVEGEAVTGYAFFIGGGRAQGTPWSAEDAGGATVASGTTDGDGGFRFVPPQPVTAAITVTVDTREGHIASATIAASRFGTVARALSAQPVAAPPAAAPAAGPRDEAPAASAETVVLIEAAVQHQVAPLLERIEAMDDRLRLTDVMSGIFLIVGLAGIGLWARSRRR